MSKIVKKQIVNEEEMFIGKNIQMTFFTEALKIISLTVFFEISDTKLTTISSFSYSFTISARLINYFFIAYF
jgi:hypothetical protein